MSTLDSHSAVILIPNDIAKTGFSRPMMLQRVMGVPLLSWLVNRLVRSGVDRYFLACHDRFLAEARACFPRECTLTACSESGAADQMHVFLSTADPAEQQILIISGPCLYLPDQAVSGSDAGRPASACLVAREALMNAMDGGEFSFSRFLQESGAACTDCDGMFCAGTPAELAALQPLLQRDRLLELAEQGVEIWDFTGCYIDPGVRIGRGTVLMPGTVIRGASEVGSDCVIGPDVLLENANVGSGCRISASQIFDSVVDHDAVIGPFAHIRPDCRIGSRARVGSFTELKNTLIGDGSGIGCLSCLSDAEIGRNCSTGAAAVTAQADRQAKEHITVEDDAFIGGQSSLVAPVSIGRGACIAPGSVITENVPAQALGIARTRQTNKKDWALKKK